MRGPLTYEPKNDKKGHFLHRHIGFSEGSFYRDGVSTLLRPVVASYVINQVPGKFEYCVSQAHPRFGPLQTTFSGSTDSWSTFRAHNNTHSKTRFPFRWGPPFHLLLSARDSYGEDYRTARQLHVRMPPQPPPEPVLGYRLQYGRKSGETPRPPGQQ